MLARPRHARVHLAESSSGEEIDWPCSWEYHQQANRIEREGPRPRRAGSVGDVAGSVHGLMAFPVMGVLSGK